MYVRAGPQAGAYIAAPGGLRVRTWLAMSEQTVALPVELVREAVMHLLGAAGVFGVVSRGYKDDDPCGRLAWEIAQLAGIDPPDSATPGADDDDPVMVEWTARESEATARLLSYLAHRSNWGVSAGEEKLAWEAARHAWYAREVREKGTIRGVILPRLPQAFEDRLIAIAAVAA
jgi:hypothetical protein